eukprot:Pompholyxophrys_punicea_v1_NODE_485_length_1857_cov_54.259711.p2 type:complete len:129 gc:universal NODE_485_length_1857_cov_54.259711:1190-1576(+)
MCVCVCAPLHLVMNNLAHCSRLPVSPNRLQFGLSTLHLWIRSMEYFLNIAYRLDFQSKGKRTTEQMKAQMELRKKNIQRQLHEKLGIIVDMPKSGGAGTTNDDGPTALHCTKFFFKCSNCFRGHGDQT